MGKKPEERILRREGAEILARIRQGRVSIQLSEEERQHLLTVLGYTQENVDTLLSLETEGFDAGTGA
jgi:hypothetical protein